MKLVGTVMTGEERRLSSQNRLGIPVPRFCIFSVTWRCNLQCVGCYAAGYTHGPDMPQTTVSRVLNEAIALGSYVFVIVGGEPLLVPGLLRTLSGSPGGIFLLFTNGTCITPEHADAIAASDNIVPIVSIEGDQQTTDDRRGAGVSKEVERCMTLLRARGVLLGFASMVTRRNLDRVTSRAWLDGLWENGARLGFLIDYVPCGQEPCPELELTETDRIRKEQIVSQRYAEARPLIVNFPPAEYAWGPCQSGGKGFLHINADGFVEPCPFFHYAADNVQDKSLGEILASPFLSEVRRLSQTLPNPSGECLLHKHAGIVAELARGTGAFCTERLAPRQS